MDKIEKVAVPPPSNCPALILLCQREITAPEICFSVPSSAGFFFFFFKSYFGRQTRSQNTQLSEFFFKLASRPQGQWHRQLFNYTHLPLSSHIMLSNKPQCTFAPLGGDLGQKASVLCVNQHIYILVGCPRTRDAGAHLLHHNEFIVLRNSQKR